MIKMHVYMIYTNHQHSYVGYILSLSINCWFSNFCQVYRYSFSFNGGFKLADYRTSFQTTGLKGLHADTAEALHLLTASNIQFLYLPIFFFFFFFFYLFIHLLFAVNMYGIIILTKVEITYRYPDAECTCMFYFMMPRSYSCAFTCKNVAIEWYIIFFFFFFLISQFFF